MAWFKNWFGTKYYQLLYCHRDESEASAFIDRLTHLLKLPAGSRILDVACGQGRHSHYLASLGFKVTGLDVVPENIETARAGAREDESFFVHDMREPFPVSDFDLVLNLFTSFGYFDDPQEDNAALKNMAAAVTNGGHLVIDFLNATKVIADLVPSEQVVREGVTFDIRRKIENDRVIKTIQVLDEDFEETYEEQVHLLSESDFTTPLTANGLRLIARYGDYKLSPFQPESSDRLILIFSKTTNS